MLMADISRTEFVEKVGVADIVPGDLTWQAGFDRVRFASVHFTTATNSSIDIGGFRLPLSRIQKLPASSHMRWAADTRVALRRHQND